MALPHPIFVSFVGGNAGPWQVEHMNAVTGPSLPKVERVAICEGKESAIPQSPTWILHGVTSHQRYTKKSEQRKLAARQPPLGRSEATCAALIAIQKSDDWWALCQDERRKILEEQSHHIAVGLNYLPAIARRLIHSRDLGEPFDFLTWFEFSPSDTDAFDELLVKLRGTSEWSYVVREVDVRLRRQDEKD